MRHCLALAVFGLSFLAATAHADPALARIKARGSLIVSVKNEGERQQAAHKDPAHFAKRDFEIGIARALAAHLTGSADTLELRQMRKPLRLPAVVSGEVDLAISMFRVTPEAAVQVEFSTPYYDSALAALTLPGMSPASLAALNGKRLALIERNDAGGSELPAGVTPASTTRFGRFERAAEALKAGEVDALLSERANIESFIKDGHPEFVCSVPWLRTPIAVALPKGNPDLLREVNATIEALKTSGELARMAGQLWTN